jgi:hypothetical protein
VQVLLTPRPPPRGAASPVITPPYTESGKRTSNTTHSALKVSGIYLYQTLDSISEINLCNHALSDYDRPIHLKHVIVLNETNIAYKICIVTQYIYQQDAAL